MAVGGLALTACNDGGGGLSGPIGDNDPAVVLALGDSITDGGCVPAGAPYPSRLAGLIKKTVVNAGVCGDTTEGGRARVGELLKKHDPGTLLILLGANDMIRSRSQEDAVENLRAIIRAAKANQTRVVVATVLPMVRDHLPFNGSVEALNPKILSMAKAEKAKVVNLFAEFDKRRDTLLQEDGLHPNDAGTQIIANAFADVF